MNKLRRKEIKEQIGKLQVLKDKIDEQMVEFSEKLEDIKSEIDRLYEEEEECYNNLPESLQEGERGEAMQTAIDNLENASNDIQYLIDELEGIMLSNIDEAVGYLDDAMA